MFEGELDSFKRIDLRAYAASLGYQLDRKESWRGAAVMRDPKGDKIVIKRDAGSGHYVYFSVRDDKDNGTIIDFVERRAGLNLRKRGDWAKVGNELRPWIGLPPVPVPSFPELHKTAKDRMRVEAEYMRMTDAVRHPYLETERGIAAELLGSTRFARRIRIDRRGNAIFPHEDDEGLCGYEIKNHEFTGFASGGSKGIWMSHRFPDDRRLVLCEAAIDALSYAILQPDSQTRYGSIGGKPNPRQPGLIRAEAAVMPAGAVIVAAMDADADGRKLAEIVRDAVKQAGRSDLGFELHEPDGFKDWNDQLRGKQPGFFPAVRKAGLDMR